jgi:hypothetical protein
VAVTHIAPFDANLAFSSLTVNKAQAQYNDVLTYTLVLSNQGSLATLSFA